MYLGRGDCFRQKKEYCEAIADFDEAIRLNPAITLPAYERRGEVLLAEENVDKAMADFDEAIRLDPDDAEAFFRRGYCWQQKREGAKAIADYTEAIRIEPQAVRAYVSRADVRACDGGIRQRQSRIATLPFRLDPKNAEAYSLRGVALLSKHEDKEANADLARAIALSPTFAENYRKLALEWRAKRDSGNAATNIVPEISLDPNDLDEYAKNGSVLGDPADYDKPLGTIPGIMQIPANKSLAKEVAAVPRVAKADSAAGKPAAEGAKKDGAAAGK